MTPRRQRMALVAAIVVGVGVAVTLGILAIGENMLYFYSPTQLLAGEAPLGKNVRVGGLVVDGSVRRKEGDLTVKFDLTDNNKTVTVSYSKVLPDLFREGQGIVATGKLLSGGSFVAEEVLAKHDENYMPPEVAEALKKGHEEGVARLANPEPPKQATN